MCGIAGFLKLNQIQNTPKIRAMLDLVKYRGPDDEGVYEDERVVLGHRRLSILDLSDAGHQPMEYEGLVIVYNGEIYNYIELRDELKNKGYKFKTQTDTEVILASFKEWGEESVKKFNGMWAFAIWDKEKTKLFISRDRFGIKPFFYYQDAKLFAFASEIKSLLAVLKQRQINHNYLYNFIDRQTSYNDNKTVFRDIRQLLPAHNLIINLNYKLQTISHQYWHLEPKNYVSIYDYSKPIETFRELLIDAVKLRLRSDVPVGVCLSGGIDSSVITCIITKILKQRIATFSSIYLQPAFGEKEFIDEVNNQCNTEPYLIYPNAKNFFQILTLLIRHHDKPVRMPGPYSQWHVFKCANQQVVVTLDGQGADELLAGYPYYYPSYLADLIKKLSFRKYYQSKQEIQKYLKINFNKDVIKILFPYLVQVKQKFNKSPRWHDQILNDEFIRGYSSEVKALAPKKFTSHLNQHLFETFVNTNLPMLLTNEDRISMAFSLEARVPFLDYRLVEFCFGLPDKYKLNGYTTKYILREAFKDVLPKRIYQRKDKKGFPTPLADWFRHELKDELKEILSSSEFGSYNILDRLKVKKVFSQHLAGNERSRLLWRALGIHYWLKEYF